MDKIQPVNNRPAPRLAFFTDSFHETNGVALTSRQFEKFARDRRYPFFSVHAGPVTRRWRDGELETFELGHSPLAFGLEHDLKFDLLFLRNLGKLRKAVAAFRPDIIHITGPSHLGMLGAIIALQLNIPVAASWHTNVHEYLGRRLNTLLLPGPAFLRKAVARVSEWGSLELAMFFYTRAGLVFAPNPELRAMLAARCVSPVRPMYRGIDVENFNPRKRSRTGGAFRIGYAGRVSAEKNVRALAAVEAELRNLGVTDYQFQVIGEGSELQWLKENLKQADFPGVLKGEPLARAYADLDVLLFPSETDTFGNVVLEAAASAAPPIVSVHGGPKFLIKAGVTGFACANPGEFAASIASLAKDPARHEAMRQAARSSALGRSWDAVFNGIYDAYRAVLLPAPPATDEEPADREPRAQFDTLFAKIV